MSSNDTKWDSIQRELERLPREVTPTTDLWRHIEPQLGADISLSDTKVSRVSTGWMPYAVAASLLVAICSSVFSVYTMNNYNQFKQHQTAMMEQRMRLLLMEEQRQMSRTQLVQALNASHATIDSAVVADVNNNLMVLGQAIADIKAVLVKEPGNVDMLAMLEELYRQEQKMIAQVQSSYSII